MPVDVPPGPRRPRLGKKGRFAVYGGLLLAIAAAVYVYRRHQQRQDDAAAAADPLAFEDPTVPMPDPYGPTMLSPVTSGAAAGGYGDTGGVVHTYTLQDIMDLLKATDVPSGGGYEPPPLPNWNPDSDSPAPSPSPGPAPSISPTPAPTVVASGPQVSAVRIVRTCHSAFNQNGNCWTCTVAIMSDGSKRKSNCHKVHNGRCHDTKSC